MGSPKVTARARSSSPTLASPDMAPGILAHGRPILNRGGQPRVLQDSAQYSELPIRQGPVNAMP